MNNILIIDAHPDPGDTLGHILARTYAEGARDTGSETRLIRVADLDFPLVRSAAEFAEPPTDAAIVSAREDIAWANHLVLVFPVWLGSAPALIRGFLEQVGRADFFAGITEYGWSPAHKEKSARLIVTMAAPSLVYRFAFGAHGVKAIARSILEFAGVRPVRLTLFGGVTPNVSQSHRIERVRRLARREN